MSEEILNISSIGNVSSNFSLPEYILTKLGPKRLDLATNVLLSIIYGLIFVSGTFGNVCTCIVIVKNNYMQTTTNYYLFSLAVSDLMLILFGLPPELYAIWESYPWRFGEPFCIIRHSVMEMTSYASVLTITSFTVERYMAICRPLHAHRMVGLSRCVKIIILIWFIALLAALPYAIHTRVFYELYHPETNEPIEESFICNIRKEWRVGMTYMFQVSTFLFFVSPVTLIIVLYILIGIALRKSSLARDYSDDKPNYKKCGRSRSHSNSMPQPRRVIIRMLVAVTAAFIICWAPFHAQRLMVLYVSNWTPELMNIQSTLFYISGVLYFVSATVNPILYNVISKRYREAFKETICFCCYRHGTPTNSSTLKWPSDKSCRQPTMIINRDSNSHITFQDSPVIAGRSMNGTGRDTIKMRLLNDKPQKDKCVPKMDSLEEDTVSNSKVCKTKETKNGYLLQEDTIAIRQTKGEILDGICIAGVQTGSRV
ncbi:pyrokinin-1 receptor-like [Gigantopelta aegis]|uniref:pyrokinin-1 receptor-like n=1 Tax=Gigantopelta aegis TaxID=1735272 RepID=UPI001B887EF8|nr:pyrokinin-1 receptor-like [Gigantopelta aegis]